MSGPEFLNFRTQISSSNLSISPEPPPSNDVIRQRFVTEEPPLCECARIGSRPLAGREWNETLSDNRVLDVLNKELSHEHIMFEASGDNIGFGAGAQLYSEDVSSHDYRWDPTCYDGSTMRKAIALTEPPSKYWILGQNCQVYVERVLNTYNALMGRKG